MEGDVPRPGGLTSLNERWIGRNELPIRRIQPQAKNGIETFVWYNNELASRIELNLVRLSRTAAPPGEIIFLP